LETGIQEELELALVACSTRRASTGQSYFRRIELVNNDREDIGLLNWIRQWTLDWIK